MKKSLFVAACLFSVYAIAQQAAPQPEPTESDMRILVLTNQRNQALDLSAALNARLMMLEAENKKLKEEAAKKK